MRNGEKRGETGLVWSGHALLIDAPSSYLISLSHIIFKNIAHVGSFSHLSLSLSLSLSSVVTWHCSPIYIYIYLLLYRVPKLIYTGRLSSWMFCLILCPRICLCVCLCHCLCHLRMNPGNVLFPAMYDMWVAMLKSLECGCLSIIGLQRDDDEDDDEDENHG